MMIGGSGDTHMYGGEGNDTMISGSGNDVFEFNSNGGQNVVMGFHNGDMLSIEHGINGLHINDAADVAAHVQDVNGSAVIHLGDESITLVGIKAEDIHNNPTGYFVIH
jgi:Ca2+-binding RTX toxin-like protein